MKHISLKKYQQLNINITSKISHILSRTRNRTSKIVKFWKHIGQLIRERIPVLSPLHELIIGKGFISEVSIVKYSVSRWGRIVIICTEAIFAYILIFYGRHIITEAKDNISMIIFRHILPDHISIETVILMIIMSIGSIGYYGMIKPGDFRQAVKEHREESE